MTMTLGYDHGALLCGKGHKASCAPSRCFFLNSMDLGFISSFAMGFLLFRNNNHKNGLRKNEWERHRLRFGGLLFLLTINRPE
ncbi:transmembrane protein, putative [Medicago truncatula]|uniref:Transmembrane protein, putative n=1 Tax=Medicago truncatula TaxID=3880 RepID=A0A072UV71_MEDTR|nr:transmembrane protein, putative [Medicago truncatula]